MADENILQGAGDFAADAAVDTTADNLLNNVLGTAEQKVPIPGGQTVDKMINTEVDQVVNNEINQELNKGVGGILGDVEGLFGGEHKG
jgi:DNA gyrase/topoisomerase IV subunit B